MPLSPSAVLARVKPLVPELSKFVVVGGVCFAVDFVLAYLFVFELGLGPTTAKTLSTVLATTLSYLGNRLWSFAHRVDDDASQTQDALVFGLINAAGLVITLVPVDITHYLLDQTGRLAFNTSQVIGTAFATVFRFWAYRKWVFVGGDSTSAAERSALV